ncbi:MAG: CbtA family protein [Methylococcales bacterium]
MSLSVAMFRRIVIAAVIAGVLAGITLTVLQASAVVPLILEVETFERAQGAGHQPAPDWAPEDGTQRTLYTALANSGTGIGFALLLGALFALREPVSVPQGMLWGGVGYLVFYLNPGLGLPPELPGTPSAPLLERQIWWLSAVLTTAGGIALLVTTRQWFYKLAVLALLALPHLAGAPHAGHGASSVPEDLAGRFVFAATWTNGAFWLLLGTVLAWLFERLGRV